jgi:N-methylhydantoinase A
MSGYACGIDIGGTFTDAVVTSPSERWAAKADSIPNRPSEAVLDAIDAAAAKRSWSRTQLVRRLDQIVLGSTLGTNAIVERTVGRTGLLTTRGFEDTLFIMRGGLGRTAGRRWDELSDPFALRKPQPLVHRADIRGINERTIADGAVLVQAAAEAVVSATAELVAGGIQSLAVSFLWSCANPFNERLAGAAIAATFPDLFVCCSHEVSRRTGEYERTVAAVVNAALGPTNAELVVQLEDQLRVDGFEGKLFFLTSSGGVIDREGAVELPVLLVGSGPAGGVAASVALAAVQGHHNAILCDMGGTTFDVGLIWKQIPLRRSQDVLGGYTFHRSSADVVSIGAGGGSVAWADEPGGLARLRVGPRSAGAEPGPACYGRGGSEATVTDADLVLGYLAAADYFGNGTSLDEDAARRALTDLGSRWGWNAEQTAANIVRVVDAQMADLIRQVTIERGLDPAEFALYAFGGGGPLHIGGVGRELRCREVIVPAGSAASVFSALGAATAEIVRVFSTSVGSFNPWSLEIVDAVAGRLAAQAAAFARQFGVDDSSDVVHFSALIGYTGQVHAMELPMYWRTAGDNQDEVSTHLPNRFFEWYDERYGSGFSLRDRRVELREVRCTLSIPRASTGPGVSSERPRTVTAEGASYSRRVWWPEFDAWDETPVVEGDGISLTEELAGPAIVNLDRSAILVHPEQRLRRTGEDIFVLQIRL